MSISFNSLGGYGHLGNQMFQYASLRGIANNLGHEFSVPPTGHRLFEVFNMTACTLREVNNIVMQSETHAGFEFDQELFQSCKNYTDLYGYFQTEKYFKAIEESIREDFMFIDPDEACIKELREIAGGKDVVSIHVRRGDYLGLSSFHPVMTEEYYRSAMSKFDSAIFTVFSDDTDWCRGQEFFNDAIIYDAPDSTAMFTMSQCDHNIIANSSFSWWGAWLNRNPEKIIIAPKRWFGPSYIDYNVSDLYPDGWIKI